MKITNQIKRYARGPLPLAAGGALVLTLWAAVNLVAVFVRPPETAHSPLLLEKLETASFAMLEDLEDQGARPDRVFDPDTTRSRAARFSAIYDRAIPAINAAAAGLPEIEEALVRAHEWMSRIAALRNGIGATSTEQECKVAEAAWRAHGSQAVAELRMAALGLRSVPGGALEEERRKRVMGLLIVFAIAAATGVAVIAAIWMKPALPSPSKAPRSQPNPPLPSPVESAAAAAIDYCSESILTLDPGLRILGVNPAAESLFGYPAAQLQGADIHVLLPSMALRGGIPDSAPEQPSLEAARHRSGHPMQVELSLHPVNRRGRQTIVAVIREASRASVMSHGGIPEASVVADMARHCPSPFVIYDTEGHLVHVNEAFTELMAAEFDGVHGWPYWEIFLEGESAEKARREWLLLAVLNLPDSACQEWRTLDGRMVQMTWARSALRDDQGRVRFVVAIGAERRQRPAELPKAA